MHIGFDVNLFLYSFGVSKIFLLVLLFAFLLVLITCLVTAAFRMSCKFTFTLRYISLIMCPVQLCCSWQLENGPNLFLTRWHTRLLKQTLVSLGLVRMLSLAVSH